MEPFSTYAHVDVDYTDRTYDENAVNWDESKVNWYYDNRKDYTTPHIHRGQNTITLPYIPNQGSNEIGDITFKGDTVNITPKNKKKVDVRTVNFYVVACHTTVKSSFYSQPFTSLEEATAAFTAYQDVVDYFGGTVDLLAIYNDDYNIEDTYRSRD